jgi:hypothetical protein
MIETLKTEARINLRVVSPFFAPRPARENFGPKLTKSQLQREREREREREIDESLTKRNENPPQRNNEMPREHVLERERKRKRES